MNNFFISIVQKLYCQYFSYNARQMTYVAQFNLIKVEFKSLKYRREPRTSEHPGSKITCTLNIFKSLYHHLFPLPPARRVFNNTRTNLGNGLLYIF